ncbi:MAG: thioredoxin family protein [Telluria sp.]
MSTSYQTKQPERAEIDALPGTVALEFGTGWCGFCQAAGPIIAAALKDQPAVRHIRVEDGPGRPLGRSFRVKLWPTVIIIKDGQELTRVVRPHDSGEVREALALAAKT